jgi:hypothetical protein
MVAIWLFSDWIDVAFDGGFVVPLLGIIFLPWTVTLYTVGYIVGDAAAPWGWLGVFIGLFLDVAVNVGGVAKGRNR